MGADVKPIGLSVSQSQTTFDTQGTTSRVSVSTSASSLDAASYKRYGAASQIRYTPESALKEGLAMVKAVKANIGQLQLGSELRKEVWIREVERLQNQTSPPTLVAICGATGAGKSSIINAILDDDIVPTSGVRACTSVVTEIAYHPSDTINADISFLSEDDWRAELGALLEDLAAHGSSSLRRNNDDTAVVAWEKVHAVYPSISLHECANRTVDEIMTVDPNVAEVLGSTRSIVAPNSTIFQEKIAEYIDSKNRTGDKTPAWWPLILKVAIRCPSKALSTGCHLVDLPGANDMNAARNKIATQFMKRCDCVWVLAPITRAVDDKTARDLLGEAFKLQMKNGHYDAHAITFIATKCDDISPREVIKQLRLGGEPTLLEIERHIGEFADRMTALSQMKAAIEHKISSAQKTIKDLQDELEKYKHSVETVAISPRTKRKNFEDYNTRSRKRRQGSPTKSGQAEHAASSDVEFEGGSGSGDCNSDAAVQQCLGQQAPSDAGGLQRHVLNLVIAISGQESQVSSNRQELIDTMRELQEFEQRTAKAESDKKQFCALKRSQFASEILKEDFRFGLKELDDAIAEEQDPDNFDPDEDLRDYRAVDLPVFTVSARDYVQLTRQVENKNRPSCFSQVDDTGVPQLQSWCHQLTISSRHRVARTFLAQVKISATSIKNYIQRIGDVTLEDRRHLRDMWESSRFAMSATQYRKYRKGNYYRDTTDSPSKKSQINAPKKSDDTPSGVIARLTLELGQIIKDCVGNLQQNFREGLEDKCLVGASNAAETAVQTTEKFADSMHFNSFRAALRRHGSYRGDLNVDLLVPFIRSIAQAWCRTFQTNMFTTLEEGAVTAIEKLLKDVEESSAPGLKDYAAIQAKHCVEMTKVAMDGTLDLVRKSLNSEQRELSRSIAPDVQERLRPGYDNALEVKGKGSVARQKLVLSSYVDGCKDEMFNGGAQIIVERLKNVAESIGKVLTEALEELAVKIEVSLAVLWENRDHVSQAEMRVAVTKSVQDIIEQIEFWQEAERGE